MMTVCGPDVRLVHEIGDKHGAAALLSKAQVNVDCLLATNTTVPEVEAVRGLGPDIIVVSTIDWSICQLTTIGVPTFPAVSVAVICTV